MKKQLLFYTIFCLILAGLLGQNKVNDDKPLRGNWDLKKEPVWEISSAADEPLVRIRRFRIAENGDIYIFDSKHNKFFTFDSNGKFLYSFGRTGEGPGEYRLVLDFFLLPDALVAVDISRLHFFNRDGSFQKDVITTPGTIPIQFVNADQFVYIPQNPNPMEPPLRIDLFDIGDKSSTPLVDLTPPGKKPAPVRTGGNVMIRVGGSGDVKQKTGFVVGRIAERLYWGKSGTYLLKEIDLKGAELLSFSVDGRKRQPISQAFKKEMASNTEIRVKGGNIPKDLVDRLMQSYSDFSTYFYKIVPGANGLIYVYVSDFERQNGQAIDVFSIDGSYLYRVDLQLPTGYRILADGPVFEQDFLFMVEEDDEGEIRFVKYKIALPTSD